MAAKNLNLCGNCRYWLPCGVTNDEDDIRPCTNDNTFIAFPKTLNKAKKLLDGDKNMVLIDDYTPKYARKEEKDYVMTGCNFGCIHFESKINETNLKP